MIRSYMLRILPVVAITLMSSACRDDRKETPVGPAEVVTPQPVSSSVAYLTISDSAPTAGSTVIVTAFANGSGITYGSFAARLKFAATGLTYVGEAGSAAGMRAINPQSGDVAVAGVNLDGFAEGQLFAVELRVVDPAAVASLELTMSELTSVSYRNERASLSVQKAVRFARTR